MKKAFIVNYSSKTGKSRSAIELTLSRLGEHKVIIDSLKSMSWLLIPTGDEVSASSLRLDIYTNCDPFDEVISVIRVNALDVAGGLTPDDTEGSLSTVLEDCKDKAIGASNNFSRFSNISDAKHAYSLENPVWIFDYSSTREPISFGDWLWLPINTYGMYKKADFRDYV